MNESSYFCFRNSREAKACSISIGHVFYSNGWAMKKLFLTVTLLFSPISVADEVDELFKKSMQYYRNAVFCVAYHYDETRGNEAIQSAYYSIGQSLNKLQQHASGYNEWKASDIISHIVINEAVEQKMPEATAKLKNRCMNILQYGLSSSAASLSKEIARLEKEGKL